MLKDKLPARGWTGRGKPGKSPPKAGVLKVMGKGWTRMLAGLVLAAALAGCATGPASPEALAANDPYEQMNRAALKRNAIIDRYFVIPTVGLYFLLVPEPGR